MNAERIGFDASSKFPPNVIRRLTGWPLMVSGRRTLVVSGLSPRCITITTQACVPRVSPIADCRATSAASFSRFVGRLFTTFDETTVGARVPSVIYRKLCCSADLLSLTKMCRGCFDVERYRRTRSLLWTVSPIQGTGTGLSAARLAVACNDLNCGARDSLAEILHSARRAERLCARQQIWQTHPAQKPLID